MKLVCLFLILVFQSQAGQWIGVMKDTRTGDSIWAYEPAIERGDGWTKAWYKDGDKSFIVLWDYTHSRLKFLTVNGSEISRVYQKWVYPPPGSIFDCMLLLYSGKVPE